MAHHQNSSLTDKTGSAATGDEEDVEDYEDLGVSRRARDMFQIRSQNQIMEHIDQCMDQVFDDVHNPQGIIPFGLAENKMAVEILRPKLEEIASAKEEPWIYFYGNTMGNDGLRLALKRFLEHNFPPHQELDVETLFVTDGATLALEAFAFALAMPGEYIMIPRPYYFRLDNDFKERAGVNVLPVDQPNPTDFNDRYALDVEAMERAYLQTTKEGKIVRAIHITNPNNPTGDVYTAEELKDLLDFANRYKLHVIANELYGLSVFDEKVKFTSILSLPHPDPTRVHYMWATSKDFGLSGFRLSVEYTRNRGVARYLRHVGVFLEAAGCVQSKLTRLLEDLDYFDAVFKPEMRRRIVARFKHVNEEIEACGGRVHHSPATVFRWLDLRAFLTSPDWEGETQLYERLKREGVFLVSGSFFNHGTPGWFRMVVAMEESVHNEGMKRLVQILKTIREEKQHQQQQQPQQQQQQQQQLQQ